MVADLACLPGPQAAPSINMQTGHMAAPSILPMVEMAVMDRL